MPLTAADAQNLLTFLSGHRNYMVRAKQLLVNPEKLTQGRYGVCGMASVVYTLLCHSPPRIVALLRSAILGESFRMKGDVDVVLERKAYDAISRGAMRVGAGQNNVLLGDGLELFAAKDPMNRNSELDFIMSRSLGFLLEMVKPDLYDGQIRFSRTLSAHFSEQNAATRRTIRARDDRAIFHEEGDLGMTPLGLQWLLVNLAGVEDVDTFERGGQWAILRLNEAFRAQRAGRQPVAYAFVLDSRRFEEASDGDEQPFDTFTPPARRVRAEHIVVITGRIVEEEWYYAVPVWTWGKLFTVRVAKHLFDDFFSTIVLGSMSAT